MDADEFIPSEDPPPNAIGVQFVFDEIGDVFRDRGGILSFKNLGPPLSVTRVEFDPWGDASTPPTSPGGLEIGATIMSWTVASRFF